MPVLLDGGALGCRLYAADEKARGREAPVFLLEDSSCIDLGLINNMPDLALEQTERQILKLLDAAASELVVRLKLFALPDVPRGGLGKNHLVRLHYRYADDLLNRGLDGVIITGAEPRAADLTLEPYWKTLTQVFDWAQHNTISTIMSCLAVHAAVLHFDGIDRHPLKQKRFGVFNFEKTSENLLLKSLPSRWQTPHSRWNDIREDHLTSCGYEILGTAQNEGVDIFLKSKTSLFVFFQGHPEYEAWTLLGEYRRDIARFLNSEQETYPEMPLGYFDRETTLTLDAFRALALDNRRNEMMANFPAERLIGRLADTWRSAAVITYSNWLRHITLQKAERLKPIPSAVLPRR
jgi:homoserine O-succinyltransferase/O-acetyltransferase